MTSEELIAEIEREFPDFAIKKKRDSRLQRVIGRFLYVATIGGQKSYLSEYHTVMFGKLWVPDAWDEMSDVARVILLRHERVHLRQRERMGDVIMGFAYLFWFFPIGLAYGRARIEWEAYEETIRATLKLEGRDAALALKPFIVRRFTGPDYAFMWPFRKQVESWFDTFFATLD